MTELSANDEIVTIDGKQYNRLMAEEMARDIELLSTIAPRGWSISDNSSLKIDKPSMLSFAEPIEHGYLFAGEASGEDTSRLVEEYGQAASYSQFPDITRIELPQWDVESLSLLRPGHERAVRTVAEIAPGLSPSWKWHNMARFRDLEQVVGRSLPQPGYMDDLLVWREQEVDSTDLSGSQSFPSIDQDLLDQIAAGIEVAHEINPNSWAVFLIKSGLVFNVSGYTAAFIAKARGTWMLAGRPDDVRFEEISSLRKKTDFAGVSDFQVFADERAQLKTLAATYEQEFLTAVRDLAEYTKTITPRSADFQTHVLDQIAGAVGRELPRPAYVDTMSTPAGDDAGSSPPLFPGLDRVLLDQLARDIEIAHAVNPKSWALVQLDVNEPRLYVNRQIALLFSVEHCTFVLKGRPDHPRIKELRPDISEERAAGSESFIFEDLIVDEAKALLDEFQNTHTSAIRTVAGSVKTQLAWARLHKAELVEALAISVGRELPQPGYLEDPKKMSSDSVLDPLPAIRTQFASSGLHYTDAQIATFYTSLQTKGFVVLSGISGTGKSKIATGFVEMLPSSVTPLESPVEVANESLIPIEVTRTTKNSGLVNFPVKRIEEYPAPAPGDRIRIPVTFGSARQDCLLNHMVEQGNLYRLYFSGSLRKEIVDLPLGTMLYFRTLVDDEALAISGFEILLRDDIDAVEPVHVKPEQQDVDRKNHLFLSVRPDWRDSTSLLGYYNPLVETYEWTDFLHFIIRARDNWSGPEEDRIAWFVILDEMNLAHVEYYFADLLSVLESGRNLDNGLTAEPLRLTYPDTLDDDVPPREVRLPPNLYIIGTVNMDETTHAFSPKVLDRAFTMELTEVDFRDYPKAGGDAVGPGLSDGEKRELLGAFSRDGRFALIDKDEIGEVVVAHPEIRDYLQSLNSLLKRDRFHFGYRVFDEIAQYLFNNDENGMMDFTDAFDQAVFMKVLPKFNGSKARLRSPLYSVLTWTFYPANPEPMVKAVTASFETIVGDEYVDIDDFIRDARFKVVAKRVPRC
jgi:hypothetical protein